MKEMLLYERVIYGGYGVSGTQGKHLFCLDFYMLFPAKDFVRIDKLLQILIHTR